jgi:hypothetical protein
VPKIHRVPPRQRQHLPCAHSLSSAVTAVAVALSAYRMQIVPLSYSALWQESQHIRSTRWRRRRQASGKAGAGALLHPLRGIGAYWCCALARLPACSLDTTLTHPCRFAQVRILRHRARSRRFMDSEERAKSEGVTFTVSHINGDAESSRRHGTARLFRRVLPQELARSRPCACARNNGKRLICARPRPGHRERPPCCSARALA